MDNNRKAELQQWMDLKIDAAFQMVIAGKQHPSLAPTFLNEILNREPEQKIQRISMPSDSLDENNPAEPVHLIGVAKDGKKLHILINFLNRFDIVKRSLYYASKSYAEQNDNDLHPVICINFLSYELFSQTESFHTVYLLGEQHAGDFLRDVFELHFIEFPKLIRDFEAKRADPWSDPKARWLLLLAIVDHRNGKVYHDIYKELDLISFRDDHIREALHRWRTLSQSEKKMAVYEKRLKRTLEEEVDVRNAKRREDEAFQKGAKKQQMEIAKKMLEEQMDIQYISKITGLSLKEIQELR
ncbi:Rpn family recombination-promoting nuclease/putative transposase [Ureibacillus sp. FSL K6-8385]|uniref:Rpn family recombination-promoting nuclease/putative transposase n=2 Tax=Bacillati TaxID=1783272 RepID=A0A540V5H6_9BACL|nr:Rpn family recombination-promoting nuclease/putative transposase [Ureibacillus terrenus]MED3661170.1 Rpn family recombination-promoting nuclease/putative transposase [Ureibacillus terrenus]MED3764353.1 Rpn family recombination-promoting nuclease/putative transposase [Ureibacillus terrenus]TQE91968.1 Rpn family recombination-promoting nuclease/putative transposase [Ureibacillus terrenus]